MEEPGRLQSMGSQTVGHGWPTSLSLFTFMHWRRKWQPTPIFLPGESQGWGSLVGGRLWGHTELDTTEVTSSSSSSSLFGRWFQKAPEGSREVREYRILYLFLILINLFHCTVSYLQHEGSLVTACEIQFPNQGLNPGPLYGEHRALATGPPGKSAVQDTLINRLPLRASGAQSCWARAESTAQSCPCLSLRAKSWGVLHHLLLFIA